MKEQIVSFETVTREVQSLLDIFGSYEKAYDCVVYCQAHLGKIPLSDMTYHG